MGCEECGKGCNARFPGHDGKLRCLECNEKSPLGYGKPRSTKPTYEDLEEKIAALLDPNNPFYALNHSKCYESLRQKYRFDRELWDADKEELVRVRGLLQHQWISVEERLPEYGHTSRGWNRKYSIDVIGYNSKTKASNVVNLYLEDCSPYTHWMPLPIPPNFRESSSLVPQGAESQEMGKANMVDECDCGAKGVCRKCFDKLQQAISKAGSAETGGEKAGIMTTNILMDEIYAQKFPHLYDETIPVLARWLAKRFPQILLAESSPLGEACSLLNQWLGYETGMIPLTATKRFIAETTNFRRSSQNQTVSSGVEGAHEGTTANKKGESREPEKLNNAHKWITICFHRNTISTSDKQGVESMACQDCGKKFKEVALAESSLSSPPPEIRPEDNCCGLRDCCFRVARERDGEQG